MSKIPNETLTAGDFVIENNVIKGKPIQSPETYPVGKFIFDKLSSNPDHVSQIEAETGKKTTFAEMKERSIRCALWLKKQGIGSQDIIAIRTEEHTNSYVPIFASFFLGATYSPLNNLLPLEDTQALLRLLQPKVLFLSGTGIEMIVQAAKRENNNVKIVVTDNYPGFPSLNSILEDQDDDEVKNFQPEIVANSEDTAFILPTSGTTGPPKLIAHTYENLLKQIHTRRTVIYKIILWYSPSYWLSGFLNTIAIACFCTTRIIHAKFDPEETSKVIEKYKVEQLCLTTPIASSYCHSNVLKKYELKSLKILHLTGSKMNPKTLEKLYKCLPHVRIRQAYGCTELGMAVIGQIENCKNIHSVGHAKPGVDIKIRDLKTNETLVENVNGELCVKSSYLMKGYFKNEKATKEAVDEEGWYHTGDLAYYNENGEIFIVDRIQDAIVYENQLIWPNEIEDILQRREDILEVAVISIPHGTNGGRPIAFVSKTPDSNVTEEELMKFLKNSDENKKFHIDVKLIEKLPRLEQGGKIVRKKLIEAAQELCN